MSGREEGLFGDDEGNDGVEPNCWLDKACIDQAGDIDKSLKALPIFLLRAEPPAPSANARCSRAFWDKSVPYSVNSGNASL